MSKLIVIATPIGNIRDITLRSIDVIKESKYFACEDTRTTKKLLTLLEISLEGKVFFPYHDKNEKNSSKGLLKIINENNDIVLMSEAGMPVVSDPGFTIIRECIENNITIDVLPGPSVVDTVFVLSNLSSQYSFLGFLKPKKISRQNELAKLIPGTYITLVSPYKLISVLEDIKDTLGADVEVFLGKEITKMHEKHYRGSVENVLNDLDETSIKGEFTLAFKISQSEKK